MRRLSWIVLLLLTAGLFALPVAAQEPTLADLVTAQATGDTPEFTTLLAAIQAADPMVIEALGNPDLQLTVFAPTDAAFESFKASLGEEAFAALLADPVALTRLLLYHVSPDALDYAMLSGSVDALAALPFSAAGALRITVPTLQGQHLDVQPGFESLAIDQASLTSANADIAASNGLVHAIDSVLQPSDFSLGDIFANVSSSANPQFTLLQAALDATGLSAELADPAADPVTIFAPTDEAFTAALTTLGVTAEEALADTELLTSILAYHIVPGEVYAASLGGAAAADPAPAWLAGFAEDGSPLITTRNGATLTFLRGADGQPQINNANLLVNDFDAVNGVIFVIDALLLPPSGS
jgi:uncharacterized surface protein with fasciclin (FAS1) repeats